MPNLYELTSQELRDGEFVIDSLGKANWAIKKIKERCKQKDVYIKSIFETIQIYNGMIEAEEESYHNDIANLMDQLEEYFQTAEGIRDTKTMSVLRLPDGQMKLTKPREKYEYDEDELVAYLEKYNPKYIKVIAKPKWKEYKEQLTTLSQVIADDADESSKKIVVDANGEIVPCVKVVEVPAKFEVK